MVHICYALSDKKGNYTKLVGTSMRSVFEHTAEWVTVHILHDYTLSEDNRCNLMKVAREYGQQIIFYNMEKIYPGRLKNLSEYNEWMDGRIKSGISLATWYRLLIGETLKIAERVIYLDADIIVNMDIKKLWQEKVGENGVAAVPDTVIQDGHTSFLVRKGLCTEERYFNAGVLLIDMNLFGSQENLMERGAEFLKKHELIDYLDQDIMNYFFGEKARMLPEKYNTLVSWELAHKRNEIDAKIYHYANKQYSFDFTNNYHKLFLDTFAGTPWCNGDFLCGLSRIIRKEVGGKYLIFSNLVAGRKRVVVGNEEERDKYRKMLILREDELYLTMEELNQKGFRLGNNEILIIFLPYEKYMKVKNHLEACGCVDGVHFLNGHMLTLPDAVQDAKIFLEA